MRQRLNYLRRWALRDVSLRALHVAIPRINYSIVLIGLARDFGLIKYQKKAK